MTSLIEQIIFTFEIHSLAVIITVTVNYNRISNSCKGYSCFYIPCSYVIYCGANMNPLVRW
jgi:hypothetical protein